LFRTHRTRALLMSPEQVFWKVHSAVGVDLVKIREGLCTINTISSPLSA